MEDEIYLDNNATTRPLAEVREAMLAALDEGYGNPSSDHLRGRRSRDALHAARSSVAALVGADRSQLIFTSSATEVNNFILASAVTRAAAGRARIVTSPVEHSSVMKACEYFAGRGVEVTYLPVDVAGVVDVGALARHLTTRPSLVSIQWANNETGVVQPIAEISRLCREHRVPLHVDAAQAVGKLDIDLATAGIDFASLRGCESFTFDG